MKMAIHNNLSLHSARFYLFIIANVSIKKRGIDHMEISN